MIQVVLKFLYNVIAGTAAHVILMIFGLIIALILFGKKNGGLIHLLLCVFIPFFLAGMFIAHRHLRFPNTVSLISGFIALLVPPIMIAMYNDSNWSTVGAGYLITLLGLPFSVLGSHYLSWTKRD